jgi:hypothetical protein
LIVLSVYNGHIDARGYNRQKRSGLFSRLFSRQRVVQKTVRPSYPRTSTTSTRVEKEPELPPAPKGIRSYSQMMAEGNPERYTMVYEKPEKKRRNYEIF